MNEQLMSRGQSRMGEYQESKALSEIKGKMYLARQFPRDPDWSLKNVLLECGRRELAESAQYEFPKGELVHEDCMTAEEQNTYLTHPACSYFEEVC